jgi:hypothetical protein
MFQVNVDTAVPMLIELGVILLIKFSLIWWFVINI